jgi:hypothetical protein
MPKGKYNFEHFHVRGSDVIKDLIRQKQYSLNQLCGNLLGIRSKINILIRFVQNTVILSLGIGSLRIEGFLPIQKSKKTRNKNS